MDKAASPGEVLVVGGGPAGYTAAIRAARLGARTTLIEKDRPGGACLNHACVPVKYLRYATEIIRTVEKAGRYGIEAEIKQVNWPEVQEQRRALIDNQAAGLGELLKTSGVRVIRGNATRLSGKKLAVELNGKTESYTADNIILATGSKPSELKIPGIENALKYYDLLELETLPKSLAVIGGGPVGMELATIFSGFGVEVSVIEMMPHILPSEDLELVTLLERESKRNGIRLLTASTVKHIEKGTGSFRLSLTTQDKEQSIEAGLVLLCAGQKPSTGDVDLTDSGLILERGAVPVDEFLQTNVKGIFAAGDVTGKSMLAYVAIMQGRLSAENALGYKTPAGYDAIPRCVFTRPELAGAGLSEEDARAKGYEVKVGRANFAANPAAAIYGERRGLVKVVIDSKTRQVLGMHILGPQAPLLIHEAALPVRMGLAVDEIQRTLHAHPNLSETVWEAAMSSAE
jgi:dihydrolipoamide dehydrogenase